MTKIALIAGIIGQDGSYLAELLPNKGRIAHGLICWASTFNTGRIEHSYQDWHDPAGWLLLHCVGLTDASRLVALLDHIQPDEVYNLAAQSHLKDPEFTGLTMGVGTMRPLEAILMAGANCRIYQVLSAKILGVSQPPQYEGTPFCPRTPYGVAKVYSHWMMRNYREACGMFAISGIHFNYERSRRGGTFVARKIAVAAARMVAGKQEYLYLGNLDTVHDSPVTLAPQLAQTMTEAEVNGLHGQLQEAGSQ